MLKIGAEFLLGISTVHQVEIWAYCLMPNHVHLIAVPQSPDGLRLAIGEVHRRYTRMVNFREGWRGHLWQGRFAPFVLDEPYVLTAARHVELNPVRGGWSTPRAVIGGAARLPMCEDRTTHSFRSLPSQVGATLAWVSRQGHSGRGHQTPACSRANRSTSRRRGVSGDARRKLEFSDGKSPDPSHDPQEIPNGRRADPSPSGGIRYGVPGTPKPREARSPEEDFALEQLRRKCDGVIRTRIKCIGRAELDDVGQDVWLVLMRELPRWEFDPARGDLDGWIASIASREAWKRASWRSNHAEQLLDPELMGMVIDSRFRGVSEVERQELEEEVASRPRGNGGQAVSVEQSDLPDGIFRR